MYDYNFLQEYGYFFIYFLLNFQFLTFSGEMAHDTPYEVNITIPVQGYEPIQFFLTKMCGKLIFFSPS